MMPRSETSISSLGRQTGTALIVSLIILAVVTLLGISNMKTSSSELRMAGSMRDRGVAFEAAEAALILVERQLADNPPDRLNLLANCSGDGCFNPSCLGGLCFSGEYDLSYSEYECLVSKPGATNERKDFWRDAALDVWNNNARHRTVQIDSLRQDVKYITEFLCYVARDENTPFSELENENNNGAPLFRITALAQGNGGRASVALQSTYKVLNGQ